jgi:hypothetical protein
MAMGAIMKGARHAAVCNAVTYMRDSMVLYEWVKAALKMDDHGVAVLRTFTWRTHRCSSPFWEKKFVISERVDFRNGDLVCLHVPAIEKRF